MNLRSISFMKSFFYYSIPSYVGVIITLVSIFLSSRLVPPSVLGSINIFLTMQSILVIIFTFGLDQAYCRYYNELDAIGKKGLFLFCIKTSLVIAIIFSIFLFASGNFISKLIGWDNGYFISFLLCISSLCIMAATYFSLLKRMSCNVISYSIIVILINISCKLSYLPVIYFSNRLSDILIFMALYNFIFTMGILFLNRWVFNCIFSEQDIIIDKQDILKYAIPLLPIFLVSWLNTAIPLFVIKSFMGLADAGIYSNAMMIATGVGVVHSGFNAFWIPYVFSNYKNNLDEIKKVHYYITFIMSCIALVLIFSQDVIYKFIGTSFQEGKYLFPFLVFSPVCYTLAETTGIGINISKKTYLHFCVYSVSIIVNFCACKMMIPVLGIIGAGIAVSLSSISMFITKTLFGQYFLKTINSWYKTAYALIILLTVAFAQILLKNNYKYLIYIGSMIILCVIFKENIMNLIRLLFYICKDKAQLSRHHNQQQ